MEKNKRIKFLTEITITATGVGHVPSWKPISHEEDFIRDMFLLHFRTLETVVKGINQQNKSVSLAIGMKRLDSEEDNGGK